MVSPRSRRKRRRQHPLRAALAEIGIQRRAQRGARGKHGKRCRGEARGLVQLLDLVCGERTRPDPAEQRPILPSDNVFVRPRRPRCRAASGGRHRWADRAPGHLVRSRALRSPSPLSARHSQVRFAISGCGTSSVRRRPQAAHRRRADARRVPRAGGRLRNYPRRHRQARRGSGRVAWPDDGEDWPSLSRAILDGALRRRHVPVSA